jgi:hypothetical protein
MADKTPTATDRAAIMAFFRAGRALFQATAYPVAWLERSTLL